MPTYQVETENGVYEIETETPRQKMVGSVFGKVPEDKYRAGERNILGNVFERPGAAVRSAIMGKGYTAGAVNPSNVPSFQESLLDKYYGHRDKPGALKVAAGNVVSAAGLAADIATNPADVLTTLIPMTKPFQTASKAMASTKMGKALKNIVTTPIEEIGRPTAGQVAVKTDLALKEGIQKAVRPSVIGKKTAAQQKAYFDKMGMAVNDVIENKSNLEFIDNAGKIVSGKNPRTLSEALQSVGQTKESLFDKYNPMIKQASDGGAVVNGDDIANILSKFSEKENVKLSNPGLVDYAKSIAERWQGKQIPLEIAEDTAKDFNAMLKQKYMQGKLTGADISSAHIDDIVVRELRNQIADKAGIGDLKRRYGALAELERDLSHRAIVAGRQNKVGLVESAINAESISDVATGITLSTITGNPAYLGFVLRGMGRKVAGNFIKNLNSPDANIERMFKTLERLKTIPLRRSSEGRAISQLIKNASPEEINAVKSESKGQIYAKTPDAASQVRVRKNIGRGNPIPLKKATQERVMGKIINKIPLKKR